jgi:hypothetical protein
MRAVYVSAARCGLADGVDSDEESGRLLVA